MVNNLRNTVHPVLAIKLIQSDNIVTICRRLFATITHVINQGRNKIDL